MNKIITLIAVTFIFCGFAPGQKLFELEKVKEINFLESDRDEVRRSFAAYKSKPVEDWDHHDTFYTKTAEIEIEYSAGSCESADIYSFNTPEWKVVHTKITLTSPINFKSLKIDLSQYKKEKMYRDTSGLYVYHNKDEGFIFKVNRGKLEEVHFMPPRKYYPLMCDQDMKEILSSTDSIFEDDLRNRSLTISHTTTNVRKLNLNRSEIIAACDFSFAKAGKSCNEGTKVINVSTIAKDPENDVLVYNYIVSGGKIIGTGKKVQWDLSGVKPGTYTIRAAVDDGCGYCGMGKIKIVVVKECAKCR